jgi:glycosyltransferase involved in cell wall biosynthesis
MKIMIPMSYFGKQGGFRVLSNLASTWVEMGHDVTMLVHYSSQQPYFPTKAKIIWIDNQGEETICKTGDLDKKYRKFYGYKFLAILIALIRGIEKHGSDEDIILAGLTWTVLPIWMSRVNAKKFHYIQVYEPELYINTEVPGFFLLKSIVASSVLWLLSSVNYLLNLQKIVNSPIYFKYKLLRSSNYVPPGIDFSIFYPKSQDLESDRKNKITTLGCIGRQEAWKGTADVLDAFDILKQENCNVKLLVAYGNLPENRKLSPDCHIVIPKNDGELGEFYRSVDIMIAPGTIQLGAPHYPVMEAMACGIPVITTGYIPASLERNNSWIVPINDPQAISNAVREIIKNTDVRNERILNANKDIQDFSWEAVSEKMLNIFKDISDH